MPVSQGQFNATRNSWVKSLFARFRNDPNAVTDRVLSFIQRDDDDTPTSNQPNLQDFNPDLLPK